tara:strand:+ start:219 stop:791 length:573 start_codon:yes stop_codon:yes gene_type:complete
MHRLNNNWTLWLHLPHDVDWSISSYKKVLTFDMLEDSIRLIENIDKELVEKCMLFIMKDNIKPIWEDPDNSKGGCLSYKINVEYVYEVWKKLNYYLIGGSLIDNVDIINNINGISISPKKNFCIIKFWVNDSVVLKTHDIFRCLDDNNKSDISNNALETDEHVNIDPLNIDKLCDIEPQHCLYKQHAVLY